MYRNRYHFPHLKSFAVDFFLLLHFLADKIYPDEFIPEYGFLVLYFSSFPIF